MTVPGGSPLNYPTNAQPTLKRVTVNRAPTSNDYRNFREGDEWLDKSSDDWWKLADITQQVATWVKIGGTGAAVESFIPDSGTSPVVPNASNEITVTGGDGTQVVGSLNTLTIGPDENGYPITPYVVGPLGQAGYQTIQSAIDAATAAGGTNMIWIQPGAYTEDLNITSSITFMSVDGAASITGTHTPPTTGTVTFEGLVLISATHIIDSNAAGSTTFNINDSFIIITNGYIFNVPNWTGEILMDNCGEGSTNDGVINNVTGSSNVKLINVEMGAGSGNTMELNCSGGFLRFDTCNVNCPVNMAGSGDLIFQNGVKFANTVTIGGSLAGFAIDTQWRTGAAQALLYNTSGDLTISNGEINSTNNPAIGGTGAGTLTLTNISFPNNSSIAGTVTYTGGIGQSGSYNVNSTGDPTVTFNALGDTSFNHRIDNGNSLYQIRQASDVVLQSTTDGEITKPLTPAFLARTDPATAQDNVTGNGTTYDILFPTEVIDVGGNYASPTFTAPVDGNYFFTGSVLLTDLTTSATDVSIGITFASGSFAGGQKRLDGGAILYGATSNISLSTNTFVPLDAGDDAVFQTTVSGLAGDTVDIGVASTNACYFGGYLLG